MKHLFSLLLLFSVVQAQSLPERMAGLSPENLQRYDQIALQIKPTLSPLETSVRSLALDSTKSVKQRLLQLAEVEQKLADWVGDSPLKYRVMQPLSATVRAQKKALLKQLPLRVPYKDHQIKVQFEVSGAQPYAYGADNLTLVRGQTQRGILNKNDKVIVYFKQGGPVITQIQEVLTDRGDSKEALLLEDSIEIDRFDGGAALFIPQS